MQLTQDLRDRLKEPVKKSWFRTYMDNRVLYGAAVAEMTPHERIFYMKYKNKLLGYAWSHVAPRGIWFLRALMVPYVWVANALIVYLVWQLVVLSGIPFIGSLAC